MRNQLNVGRGGRDVECVWGVSELLMFDSLLRTHHSLIDTLRHRGFNAKNKMPTIVFFGSQKNSLQSYE
jgi:hypothetical protein